MYKRQISSCSRAIILSSKVKGTVYPNTFKKNTYNNVKVNSSYVNTLTVKSLSGKSKSAKTATLNWKKLSSASGYVVYRSASKNGSYTKISTIKKNKTITYKDSKLKRKSTYYYKIVPYTTIGKTTVYGLDLSLIHISVFFTKRIGSFWFLPFRFLQGELIIISARSIWHDRILCW